MITLTGANPQTIELGDGYTELGASTDDGSPVTIDSSAFIDAVGGPYTILYDSTDGTNSAIQVTRDVNVVDTTASIITGHVTILAASNTPPVLDTIGDKTVLELTELSFTATATDADVPADTLSFGLANTPPATASIDSSTGAFSWPPSEADRPRTFTIDVTVSD